MALHNACPRLSKKLLLLTDHDFSDFISDFLNANNNSLAIQRNL
jgi:hypothetical protein